jgi:hypothetical protein
VASADTKALIEQSVAHVQTEVPALERLKLVVELELRGRGDTQIYRVEVPGPKVSRDVASDARVRISMVRADFNELATEGTLAQWRDAFETGRAKASGQSDILRLLLQVFERQEERNRSRKARTR